MRERNQCENDRPGIDGNSAQVLFEATFPAGHEPKIDNRPPSAVKAGLSPQEWRELNGI